MNNIEAIKTIFNYKKVVYFNSYKKLKNSKLRNNDCVDISRLEKIINNNDDNNIYLFTATNELKYFILYYESKFYVGGPYTNKANIDKIDLVSDLTMIRIINFLGEMLFSEDYKINFIAGDYRVLSKVSSFNFDGLVDGFEDAIIEEFYCCEKELISSIKSGNRRKAIKIINDIISINNHSVQDTCTQKTFLTYLNSMFKFALLDTQLDSNKINKIHLYYHKCINGNNYEFSDLVLDMTRSYCVLVHDFCLDKYSDVVRKSLEYIENNINENFTIKKMSQEIGVNASYMSTKFKKEVGTSIVDYINYRKIHKSLSLFNDYTMQICDIASKVGFDDCNYYSRLFKKIMKITPSQYRKNIKDNVNRDSFVIQ